MKKITKNAMALSLVIPSVAALMQTVEQVEANTQKEVTAFSLNVRSGPGSNYKIVDWVKKGQVVNLLKDGNGWDYIQFDNGKKGYVDDGYLKTLSVVDKTRSVKAFSLTMRSGPGANYKAVEWLTKGTKVQVLSTSGDWAKILVNGKSGYVNMDYLTSSDQSNTSSTSSSVVSSNQKEVTAYSLTMRTGPSANYKAIDWLKKGTKVQVLSTSGEWVKISVDGHTGYVHSDYLKASTSTSSNVENKNKIKEVTASSLTMRTGPSANYKAIDWLKKGTDVEVLSNSGDWAKISVNGKVGFVNSDYLSESSTSNSTVTEPSQTPTTSTSTQTKYVNSPDGLNLRSGRGINNKVVVNMPYGSTVKVSDVSNGWGKIQYGKYTGYANISYLINSKPSATVSKPSYVSGSLKGKLIVLDPGHGGPFAGAQGIVSEEDVNLSIALKTREKLQQMGAKVIMTRTGDTACSNAGYTQDLSCRPALATKMGADAFVSIHSNAGPSAATGSESFWYNSGRGDKELATSILNEMVNDVGMKKRQVAYKNLAVLRGSTVPSTLIETGFVNNKSDAAKLGSAQYQDKYAKAIAEGIKNFF